MAVIDQLKNIFKKKQPDLDQDSRLSLGVPDPSIYQSEEDMQAQEAAMSPAPGTQYGSLEGLPAAAEPSIPEKDSAPADLITVPVLGSKTVVQHQRFLSVALGLSLVALAVVTLLGLSKSDQSAQQLGATGTALMQSQRLGKEVTQAVVGREKSFESMKDSTSVLARTLRGLKNADAEMQLEELPPDLLPLLDKVLPLIDRTEKNANTILAQQKTLTQVSAALKLINRQSSDLLEIAETVSSLKLQQNAPAAEISAAGQLVMLTQRIGKSSNEFMTMEGVSPEAVFLLGKDLNSFKELANGLLDGSTELRLEPAKDIETRDQLTALIKLYEQTRSQAGAILGNLQGLVSAREAQISILNDSTDIRKELEVLQTALSATTGLGGMALLLLLASAALALLSAGGLSYVQLLDSRQRQLAAEAQQKQAQNQEQDAKRVNDANQAAILRLMNELQTVAEGDLTQEATVTEDITGAIADSVNYTVEELRLLVGNVQGTAAKVAQTTAEVDVTSTELLAASNEQLHEIRETGRSVVDMAARINQVSSQAQESADVARQSLQAAEVGLQAVQNAIGGMNAIRDQIQDTSKRIKRLGESSQEIGEITELISDITEQTNVLALNAA
ncbi:type IV pili methyl-accepting chemotaxis transducer N-terminal domain-containing protein, partial [Rhodoferax sp.]|uniref:methyl-accepting chemotaxis protein n=1 Tax=Rhodoferax sp. TaxID=50421 RepID=UPI00260BF09A